MMAKFRTLFAAGLIAGLTAAPALAAGLYGQWRVSFDAHPGGPVLPSRTSSVNGNGPPGWASKLTRHWP